MTGTPPPASIVLPTLNERTFIRDCLDSLSGQDYQHLVEILVCDGGSTDGTREIVEGYGGLVRLVDNPRVTAAAALNIGLRELKGEIYCRGDAHSLYEPEYVRRCVEVLIETGAANVGGPMRAVGATSFGRAVAAVTSSPFGVGPGRFHYATERSDVDTVYLGCWWRDQLDELGGWDDQALQWGAEDHELNLRITSTGGRIVLDPSIRSWYFPRETPLALARQYANYGIGKASTLAKHRTLPHWRPLVPAAMVAGAALVALGASLAGRPALAVAPIALYGTGVGAAAVYIARVPGVAPQRSLLALAICHWSYGIGFWKGIWWAVRGRPFQTRPRGHR